MNYKILALKRKFENLSSKEALYQKIMEWGKKLAPYDPAWVDEKHRVVGCQSVMYLHSTCEQGKMCFYAKSDALISAGLAALLLEVYNGESPETLLTAAPTFLDEIGIPSALTPGRANGLASLHLKMQQEALAHL